MALYVPLNRTSKKFRLSQKARMWQTDPNNDKIEQMKLKQRLERERINNLPENVEKRKIAMKKTEEDRKQLVATIREAEQNCIELNNTLYNKFSSITHSNEIENALQNNTVELSKLKEYSKMLIEARRNEVGNFSLNYYDKLFIDLTKNCAPQYLLYIDAEKLNSAGLPFHKLDRETLIALQDKINEELPDLLKDQEFMEKYGYYLPGQTEQIKLDNQLITSLPAETRIAYHLKNFPENYTKMDEKLNKKMKKDGTIDQLINKNRIQIKYIPVSELSWFAKNCSATLGKAIYCYPEVLKRIKKVNPNFFADEKISIKQIFHNSDQITINGKVKYLTKQAYLEAIKDYYDEFIELGIYFRIPQNLRNTVKIENLTEAQKFDLLEKLKAKECNNSNEL